MSNSPPGRERQSARLPHLWMTRLDAPSSKPADTVTAAKPSQGPSALWPTRRHNRQQPGWDLWPGRMPCCQPSVPAGVLLQMLLGFLIKTCLAELWNCITEGQLNLMLCFIFCKYWGELWAMYIVYDYKDQINAMSFSAYGNLTSVWKNRGGSIDNLKRSCTRTAKKRVNRASTRSRITSTDEIKNQRAISAMMCNCKGIYLRLQSETLLISAPRRSKFMFEGNLHSSR